MEKTFGCCAVVRAELAVPVEKKQPKLLSAIEMDEAYEKRKEAEAAAAGTATTDAVAAQDAVDTAKDDGGASKPKEDPATKDVDAAATTDGKGAASGDGDASAEDES